MELDPIIIKLAEQLHYKKCVKNHPDECDWYYVKWEKITNLHDNFNIKIKYYNKIIKLLELFKNIPGDNINRVTQIIDIIW